MATFSFQGTIVDASGEPQSGYVVTVFRKKTLRDYDTRQPIGTSDPSGGYSVGFTWSDVATGDFEVVVKTAVGAEVGRSAVLLSLGDGVHKVDIVTGGQPYRGRSEFRRIDVAVEPLAFDGTTQIPYKDLLLSDVNYLANKAKFPPSFISTFIHAHRLADLTTNDVPADAFYGMLREGLSPEFGELLAQGPESQRAALDRAVVHNLFDDPGVPALDDYIVALNAWAIDAAVWVDTVTGDKSKFRRMIDSANRSGAEGAEAKQRAFLAKYVAHDGDLDSFWASVIADGTLGLTVHDTYKWCLQIQALCNGHQPLIDALQTKRNNVLDPIKTFSDLATIDVDAWKTIINGGVGCPDTIPTDWDTADRVQRYAETLARLVSDAFPTRVVHERFKRDNSELSGADDIDTFFTNNPNFDLRSNVLQRYLDDDPTCFNAIPTTDGRRDACKDNVKAIQRLSYVAQRGSTYDTVKPLYMAGIRSAAQIDAMGPIAFVRRFSDDFGGGELGKTRARAIYDRASHVYSITVALVSKFAPAFNTVGPSPVVDSPAVPGSAPDLEALFGSMDYCGCEHCRSVYSPAAYMVDLLQFLRQQPGTDDDDALTDLQARRPDITKIDLSCANASTELPYIDIVNQLLETRVSEGTAPSDDYWQTTWTAEELALRPEHCDDGAYTELVTAAYPWNLPFDLHRTEADIYLDELGAPRHVVHQIYNPGSPDTLARARLGLSYSMAAAITGGTGFTTQASWDGKDYDELNSIKLVLETSRHTFEELQTIVATEFVGAGLSLVYEPFPDDCNLELAHIDGLSEAHLTKWHRFVRLQRALGWTAYQLDAALRALAEGSLNADFLQRLGAAKVIGERLRLEGLDLFGLWANIDTAAPPEDPDAPSYYAKLFLRRTLVNDPEGSNFALDGDELAGTVGAMNDDNRLPVAMAGLGASVAELKEIVEWLTAAGMEADTTTTLAILSAARRRITLARALKVSIATLRHLISVTGLNPFHDASGVVDMTGMEQTIGFLDAVKVVLDSKFSVAALDYILFDNVLLGSGISPDPVRSVALMATLDEQIVSIVERYALGDGPPTSSRLRDALAEYMEPSAAADLKVDATRLDDLMAIILGTSSKSNEDQEDLIEAEMAGFLEVLATTQAYLVGESQVTDPSLRIIHILEDLLPWLEARARRATTIQTLSEGLGLAIDVGEQLLVSYMEVSSEHPLVEAFESGGNLDSEGNLVSATATAFVRLYKAGALVLGHDFDVVDLAYLYGPTKPSPLPWLHVNDLSDNDLTFASWSRLAAVSRARATLPEYPDTLEVLRAVTVIGDVDTILAERGGWRATDINAIRLQLGLTGLGAFDEEWAYLTILDALDLAARAGVSAPMLVYVATHEASSGEAEALRQSLRSRHGEATWASTGKALRDPLREKQRQALVAYLLANGDGDALFSTENDLYAHYLLDVEMSACATTSRIRLALSSIQLFIQRVFLNLEAPIQFDADAAVQYRWMKNYRVWEANRKVFLYPENFLEPELRSDKSPLFAELEAALAQDEPSEKLTEKAFLGYLKGLETIAKPEVMGLVQERDDQAKVDRLHVLARTRGEPHRWLYRTREYRQFWTPWVELPVEIEGDHALPVIFNRRLYVMWPSFRLVQDHLTAVPENNGGSAQAGTGLLQIGLNWMERRFDEWGPTRSCPGFLVAGWTFLDWQLPSYLVNIRLATRTVESAATKQPTLEIMVGRAPSDDPPVDHPELELCKVKYEPLGRFLLEATHDNMVAQSVGDVANINQLLNWSYERNYHVNAAQALASSGDMPPTLRLETRETRHPYREQSVTIFQEPPMGYRLVFAQSHEVGMVLDTGFFFQDRWRSLFLQPRDIHLAGNWTPADADPGNIESGSFMGFGGLEVGLPSIDLSKKDADGEFNTLALDGLTVLPDWYAGNGGVFAPTKVAAGAWIVGQLQSLVNSDQDSSNEIYETIPTPEVKNNSLPWYGKHFTAAMFEHPWAEGFVGQVRAHGVAGLLTPSQDQDPGGLARQQLDNEVFSETYYKPNKIDTPYPRANVDFSPGGAYSVYNWELFFHAPLLLSKRLTAIQRFEEADDWLRKIFDPTSSSGDVPARYWQIKPFYESAQPPTIHELLLLLHYSGTDAEIVDAREAFEHQIWRWRRDPFNPHLIAGLRDGTYQRSTVMAYLDNLIAWGDSLFARDSIESINEATQIYILAQNILGPRPVMIDPHGETTPKNFEELEEAGLDAFSNAIVELENYTLGSVAHSVLLEHDSEGGVDVSISSSRLPHTWYFCVPPNDKLLGYWDVVEDRLNKIRHCQNLEGIERKLALFEPAIDPAALVAAAAQAGDFTSALAAVSGRAPTHRFGLLLNKALEFANEVRSLGATLLQCFEKQDAAAVAQLRASQEPAMLKRIRAVRELQISHAEQIVDGIDNAMANTQARRDHYQGLIDEGMLVEEFAQQLAVGTAIAGTEGSLAHQRTAKNLSLIPDIHIGIQGFASSPQLTTSIGGTLFSRMEGASAGLLQTQASIDNMQAGKSAVNASFLRRVEEWTLQITVADHEYDQLEVQKVAALTQVEIAKAELANLEKQIGDSEVIDAFIRTRYTNDQLYDSLAKRIKQVYKQAYNLAHRMALAAEQAYRFELQREDSFIGYQYWDQNHAGLLAGDLLVQDLRRMDAAYIDNYQREYELTKVVSLAQVDPYALATLRQTGTCYFNVPEWVYDLDHPGHIRRRIKSVSVAMPAVAGPHVGGGCTLTLESSKMRVKANGDYTTEPPSDTFVYRYGQVERIATSSGRDSTGMFEPALEGPRYMPFEGAGAISTWRIGLPTDFRQFDYESIGDVLLTIRYTAREGGSIQATAALENLESVSAAHSYSSGPGAATGASMLLRASVDFADAWYAFLRQEHGNATRTFTMQLDASRFPHAFAKRPGLQISNIRMVLVTSAPASLGATLILPSEAEPTCNFATSSVFGGHMLAAVDDTESPGTFTLSVDEDDINTAGLGVTYDTTHTRFDDTKVRELVVIVFFKDPPPVP